MTDKLTPEQRRRCMSSIRSTDTKPEIIVRKFLFNEGFRYRLHTKKLPGSPIPVDMMIDIAISEYLGIFLRIASTPRAANRQIPIAPKIGLIPNNKPRATPARDA